MAMKQPLTVIELIEHLKTLPPDQLVMTECADDYYNGPLSKEDIDADHRVFLIKEHVSAPYQPHPGHSMRTSLIPSMWSTNDSWDDDKIIEERSCVVLRINGVA